MFFKGLFIGFSLGLPAVPMNTLCVRRSLRYGIAAGVATALGIALTDSIYSFLAALSVTTVSNFLATKKIFVLSMGSISLIYLGIKALASHSPVVVGTQDRFNLIVLKTALVTLANPLTLALFIAAFSRFNISTHELNNSSLGLLTMGIFIGSTLWFSLISTSLVFIKSKFSHTFIKSINILSGVTLLMSGFLLFIKILLILSKDIIT